MKKIVGNILGILGYLLIAFLSTSIFGILLYFFLAFIDYEMKVQTFLVTLIVITILRMVYMSIRKK
jgi:hypothetical protein